MALLCLMVLPLGAEGAPQTESQEAGEAEGAVVQLPAKAANGRRRWLARRRQFTLRGVDYGLTGVPLMFANPSGKWGYGGRLHLTDYAYLPFRYKAIVSWARQPEEQPSLLVRVTAPEFSDTGWGLLAQIDLGQSTRSYFGQGNDARPSGGLTDPGDPRYLDRDYYRYLLDRQRLSVQIVRELRRPLSLTLGATISRASTAALGDRALILDRPPAGGTATNGEALVASVRWDTRFEEASPGTGALHEWSVEVDRRLSTWRYTVMDLRCTPLTPRFLLAFRNILEVIDGEMAADQYGELGAVRRIIGLGGASTLRGYESQRFVDDVRYAGNGEARYGVWEGFVRQQFLTLQVLGFVDVGRVWPRLDEIGLQGMHATVGGGARLQWDEDFVVRAELGVSPDGPHTYLLLRNNY